MENSQRSQPLLHIRALFPQRGCQALTSTPLAARVLLLDVCASRCPPVSTPFSTRVHTPGSAGWSLGTQALEPDCLGLNLAAPFPSCRALGKVT